MSSPLPGFGPRAAFASALLAGLLLAATAPALAARADDAVGADAAADAGDAADADAERAIDPRYLLLDARGRMISSEDFAGRFQLLTFGYTSCPDVCPLTLTRMVQAQRLLGAAGARLQLIFITLDPQRDGPEAIARYTAYFDAGIIGLTGSPDLVRAAARHYKVRFRRYVEPGAAADRYSIDHTAGSYLLGPAGEFIARFPEVLAPEELAQRLRAVMAQAPRH